MTRSRISLHHRACPLIIFAHQHKVARPPPRHEYPGPKKSSPQKIFCATQGALVEHFPRLRSAGAHPMAAIHMLDVEAARDGAPGFHDAGADRASPG